MVLVNYSSSSESEIEEDLKANKIKKENQPLSKTCALPELPKAASLLGKRKLPKDDNQATNDSSLHEGRIRSFQHERGNWATYVYIPASSLNLLDDIQDACLIELNCCELKKNADPHISLSKTVVLQYHFIESFVKNLEETLTGISRFSISLKELKVYANAERTRTFIGIKVDDIYLNKMEHLSSKIDSVMKNYRLPTFYEDPSYHISILWCVGDHVEYINSNLSKVFNKVQDICPFELKIEKISCKVGFKNYYFPLKQ